MRTCVCETTRLIRKQEGEDTVLRVTKWGWGRVQDRHLSISEIQKQSVDPRTQRLFQILKSSGTLEMTLERPYCKEVDATGTKSKGHLILARPFHRCQPSEALQLTMEGGVSLGKQTGGRSLTVTPPSDPDPASTAT